MVIPHTNTKYKWKLSPYITVLYAELFAIFRALLWLRDQPVHQAGFVIMTDSLSGVQLLKNQQPKTYSLKLCHTKTCYGAEFRLPCENSVCAQS